MNDEPPVRPRRSGRAARIRGAAAALALAAMLVASAGTGGAQVQPPAPPPHPAPAPVPPPVPAPVPVDTTPVDTTSADTTGVPDTLPAPRPREADLRSAWRFELADVGDSTFRFGVGGLRWLKPGTRGIVVDPRQRDALVARFEVQTIGADTATALVVGQTQRVVPDHVALVFAPPVKPWRQRSFWQGAITGALTAGVLAVIGFLAFD